MLVYLADSALMMMLLVGGQKKKTVRIELKNTKRLLSNRREMKVVIRDNDAYFNETERPRVNQVWCSVFVIDRRNVG